MPVLGKKVSSPDYLFKNIIDGDVILIMNPIFQEEIKCLIKKNCSKEIQIKTI